MYPALFFPISFLSRSLDIQRLQSQFLNYLKRNQKKSGGVSSLLGLDKADSGSCVNVKLVVAAALAGW